MPSAFFLVEKAELYIKARALAEQADELVRLSYRLDPMDGYSPTYHEKYKQAHECLIDARNALLSLSELSLRRGT